MNPNSSLSELHYSQAGYNRMGVEGAERLEMGPVKPLAQTA